VVHRAFKIRKIFISLELMGELLNTNDVGELIRKWVYWDNMISTFNKQLQNARKLRSTIETSVIQKLQQSKMENAIIQIGSGRLTVASEKKNSPLSFKTLETNLHEFYKTKGGPDETAAILAFLRKKRADDIQIEKVLKRTA
jgi:hypothetical protein